MIVKVALDLMDPHDQRIALAMGKNVVPFTAKHGIKVLESIDLLANINWET